MPFELTEEELALLTPEERAGLNEGGDDAGDDNNDQGGGDAGADAGANADVDAAGAAAAGDANADAAAGQAAANADGAAAATDESAGAEQPRQFQATDIPLIKPGQTDNADARTTELEGQLDALAEKFDSGDITTTEFLKQQRLLNKELNAIEQQRFRTELSQETSSARQQQTWDQSVSGFLNDHPELSSSNLRLQAYDFALRQVTGDEANAGKTDAQLLEMARTNWAKELGITLDKPVAEQEGAKPAGKPAETPPKKSGADRPDTPSLAGVPAAAAASVDDGRFASLDRLMESDPLKFEAELSKLSPAARDEYLQYAG